MSQSQLEFMQRIRTLGETIDNSRDVVSSLSDRVANERARMLRNGLAVVGFATLEDFLKERSREVLEGIGPLGIAFNQLPDKLRRASTQGAISALFFQSKLLSSEEKINFVQVEANTIASSLNDTYRISPLTFGYDVSNLNSDYIAKILSSFNIKKAWEEMTRVASTLGLTGLPLKELFNNAARRRHEAAHIATTEIPQDDISEFVNDAIAIAVSYDLLISSAFQSIKNADYEYLNGEKSIKSSDIRFRRVKYNRNKWKDYPNNSQKAYRVSTNKEELLESAVARARTHNQFLIHFDEAGKIAGWYS